MDFKRIIDFDWISEFQMDVWISECISEFTADVWVVLHVTIA